MSCALPGVSYMKAMAGRPRRPVQLELPLRTWGGRRRGAGRKPKGAKAGVTHRPRAEIRAWHPVHVTMKLKAGLPNLRHKQLARLVLSSFAAAKERFGVRLVQFTVQSNHVHLIVEVSDRHALSRAMQGLATRIALRLNARLGRRGKVFADRYHARALRTPLEVRRALVYVLDNHRHHHSGSGRPSRFDSRPARRISTASLARSIGARKTSRHRSRPSFARGRGFYVLAGGDTGCSRRTTCRREAARAVEGAVFEAAAPRRAK
jgi:putative transposase